MLAEQRKNSFAVADIDIEGLEMCSGFTEAIQIPEGVAGRAKEFAAHIVVHAEYFTAFAVEVLDGFRSNQPTAARDQNFHECLAGEFGAL